jgi:hypothetical protein
MGMGLLMVIMTKTAKIKSNQMWSACVLYENFHISKTMNPIFSGEGK